MNRYKLFIIINLVFHACILIGGLPPILANIAGFIPILLHSIVLIIVIKKEDSYLKLFLKNIVIFSILAFISPDIIQVGILLSVFGILLSLIAVPYSIRRVLNSDIP